MNGNELFPVKSHYIKIRYTDDGCHEFKFLCCGYIQESRSSPANFCPACGTIIAGEKMKQPGGYNNFVRRRGMKTIIRKGLFHRFNISGDSKVYEFYRLGKFERKFYGSIIDAAKILKFLNDNRIFVLPNWVDNYEDICEFRSEIFDEDYDKHSKIMLMINNAQFCEDLDKIWHVRVNLNENLDI